MLTIIANIFCKADQVELAKEAMLTLVTETRKEPGCVRYELHQDNEDAARFTFVEFWETHVLWQDHMSGAAIQQFKKTVSDALKNVEVQQLSPII